MLMVHVLEICALGAASDLIPIRLVLYRTVYKIVELSRKRGSIHVRASHPNKGTSEAPVSLVATALVRDDRGVVHGANLLEFPGTVVEAVVELELVASDRKCQPDLTLARNPNRIWKREPQVAVGPRCLGAHEK